MKIKLFLLAFLLAVFFQSCVKKNSAENPNYSLLNKNKLISIIEESDRKIEKLIAEKNIIQNTYKNEGFSREVSNNLLISFLAKELEGIKYAYTNATGEWNGTANSISDLNCIDKNTCIQQIPLYRIDTLDCYTFVNLVIAILNADDLKEFKKNIVKISYGAYNSKLEKSELKYLLKKINYVNRNHFSIPDWTKMNQANGFIANFTNPLSGIPQNEQSLQLNRNDWFLFNLDDPKKSEAILATKIKVFNQNLGEKALEFFDSQNKEDSIYSVLKNNPRFHSEYVQTNYFSTTDALNLLNLDTQFLQQNFPLPAVVGIVRDPATWNIKNLIGTEYNISHLGIIYAKEFKPGEIIYRDMLCSPKQGNNPRDCKVTDYKCGEGEYSLNYQNKCWTIMFANATSAYPDNYYFYAKSDGQYACTMDKPEHSSSAITTCNRVMSIPLKAYLEKNLAVPSIMGIHIENIL